VNARVVFVPVSAIGGIGAARVARRARPLPPFLQLEPVGQCNLRCRMCAVPFREDGPERGLAAMPFADFVRLIDGFDGLRELHLQGLGEPLMHPRFFDMVRHAAARGIAVSLNTNLTLLTERRARECAACGLAAIHVSIDGATAATYERIRLGARFDKVLRNLSRLVAAVAAVPEPRPAMRIVTVLMRDNLAELPAIVRLAAATGVPNVFVQRLAHDFGESALPPRYAPMREFVAAQTTESMLATDVEAVFDRARAAAAECGVTLRLPRLDAVAPQANPRGCDWPVTGAYVSWRGEAMPCCMVGTPDRANFGSMLEHGPAAVWGGAAFEAFRTRLASDDPPDLCRGCAHYEGRF
jgi:MoaA/NifB/PqqE/SkfB family radical SAM enzyme